MKYFAIIAVCFAYVAPDFFQAVRAVNDRIAIQTLVSNDITQAPKSEEEEVVAYSNEQRMKLSNLMERVGQ